MVIELRESGLRPEVYSYLIGMTAVVKELNELSKALRKLRGFENTGLVSGVAKNSELVKSYQSDLLNDGVRLSDWALQEGTSSLQGIVHERLLAMYICSGRGLEAEQQLWEMKLSGKEADSDLYDMVLAICGSQNQTRSISRLLTRMELTSPLRRKKTLSWLLRGFIKGGHIEAAADIVIKMLDLGLQPGFVDRAVVLQGMRKRIQQSGSIESYINLCKRLSDAGLIGPCLLYLHISRCKLWITRMV